MSRKGNPYDNAIMKSFYRTLKRELVQGAAYDNPEQALLDIFKCIETYYNTKRMHSAHVKTLQQMPRKGHNRVVYDPWEKISDRD